MKQDKMCKYLRKSSFSSYVHQKQKNKQLIPLILCQLDVGGWQKEKGTRLKFMIEQLSLITQCDMTEEQRNRSTSDVWYFVG